MNKATVVFSILNLCVLCVFAVNKFLTTETQRAQRKTNQIFALPNYTI